MSGGLGILEDESLVGESVWLGPCDAYSALHNIVKISGAPAWVAARRSKAGAETGDWSASREVYTACV